MVAGDTSVVSECLVDLPYVWDILTHIVSHLRNRRFTGHSLFLFIFIEEHMPTNVMLCISDLQLRPFRTDDFITKLFYETSRFSSFQHQWVLKARVDHDQKDPTQSSKRTLSYQLVLKSRTSSPLKVLFMALKGPYGDLKVTPSVYEFEFSNDSTESDYHQLPTVDVLECNKLLASKTINVRLVLFQVQQ